MILAEKITSLRKKNGWSQEELADKLNISRQSVSKWESGGSIPDLDKIIKLSGLFGVSTDYLLKDELEEISYSETDEDKEGAVKSVSLEEANAFMDVTKTVAGWIGVGLFIIHGMKLDKYKYMEEESITLQYGVEGIVRMKKEAFSNTYRTCIVIGVICCILSVIPMMLAISLELGEFAIACCVPILLVLIAIGVNLLVWSGTIYASFQKLLQEGDYTKENKEMERKTSFFPGIYWTLTTALFLYISFKNDSWETSWIVWPVAALIFVAVLGILRAVMKSKNK